MQLRLLGRKYWELEMKVQNKDVWKFGKKKKRKVKRCTYQTKKEVHEQFG